MDIINNRFSVGGKVKEMFFKHGVLYVLGFIAMFNLIPVILLYFSVCRESVYFKIGLVVWITWLTIIIRLRDKHNMYSPDIRNVVFLFPIGFPNFIAMYIIIKILKFKYPNSDEPKELKRFERRKKIKNILQ